MLYNEMRCADTFSRAVLYARMKRKTTMTTLFSLLAAVPALVLMGYIYKKDTVEKEPFGLLFLLFLGGCISVIPTFICEVAAESLLSPFANAAILYALLENFLGVALIEEGWKYFFLKRAWKSKHFDHLFDGVVYGVFVSLGFALVENILYVTSQATTIDTIETLVLRALLSVPLHMFCGVFMGLYFGRAKLAATAGDEAALKRNKRTALLLPIALHGFYDFCLSVDIPGITLLFIILVIGAYVFAFKSIRKASSSDRPFSA